mgnify:CR=1 FL=1
MMEKFFTSLALGLLACVIPLSAQTPTYTIHPPSTDADLDQVLEVEVRLSDFADILSQQFAVKWNPDAWQFEEIVSTNEADFPGFSSIPGVTIAVPGGNVPAGQCNISWLHPAFQGVTVPDGTVLFTFRLRAVGCQQSDIIFDNVSQFIQIEIGQDQNGAIVNVGMNPENGTANVNGNGCSGGGPADVNFSIGNGTVDQGQQVCLGVSVTDFNNIASTQLSINYDDNILDFDQVGSFNLAGLDASDFNTSTPGQITMDWAQSGGTTVSNGTQIFEMCFSGAQAGSSAVAFSGSPLSIAVTDGSGAAVNFNGQDGNVTVNSTGGGGGDLSLTIGSNNVNAGENFCLPITVQNFTDMLGFDFSVAYDPSLLDFTQVSNVNPALTGFNPIANVANPADGSITVQYFDQTLAGVSLPNDAVLFELCFTAESAGTTPVAWANMPTAIEFIDVNENIVPAITNNGNVVIDGGGGSDDLTLNMESATVNAGDDFCLAITADNFTNMLGFDFSVAYNPGILDFTQVTNVNPALTGFNPIANVANPTDGSITVQYFDQTLAGVSLPDGAVLFELCFTAESGGTTPVAFADTPTPREFIDVDENIVPAITNNGSVTVEGDSGGPVTTDLFLTSPDVTVDPGEEFCMPVEVYNFDGMVGMSFIIEYDPNLLQYESITNVNSALAGFSVAANIGNPSPGKITVSYVEPTLSNPISIPDGESLFDVCFTALGEGVETDVDFTGDMTTPFEFIDVNEELIPADSEESKVSFTGTFDGVIVAAEGLTVTPGEDFCVAFTTENFTDIQGFNFTITYDPAALSFNEVINTNSNLGQFLPSANFGNPQPGIVTVFWLEPAVQSETLPDGAVLFELCFTALGQDGSCSEIDFSDSPTSIEFTDSNENLLDVFLNDNDICIDDNVAGQVQAAIGDANVDLDANFCIPVTVDNFNSITEFGFTVVYDDQELTLDQITGLNSNLPGFAQGNFNTSNAGQIGVSWMDGLPQSLPDDAVLFNLCFTATGTPGQSSEVTFSSAVEPINFVSSIEGVMDFSGNNGTVFINSLFDGFLLTIADETVMPGENFCLPVTTLNFENVASFAFGMSFDPTQLEFQSVNNLNPDLPQFTVGGNFGLPGEGGVPNNLITTTYVHPTVSQVNLPNGSVLFELCFEAIGQDGEVSNVAFTNTPQVQIEVTDGTNIIEFNGEPGTVTISAIQPPAIQAANITDVACRGEANGAIGIDVSGGTGGPYSYTWSNGMTGDTISNLTAGSYTVTVSDNGSGGLNTTVTYQVEEPAADLAVSGGIAAPSCSGGTNGSISLNVSGGTPNYSISWDNGIPNGQMNPANLGGGTYCVTITDANGCTASDCFIIPAGSGNGPVINGTVENVSCPGDSDGSVSINVSNANGGVTYFWQPGVVGQPTLSNLSAGNYTVTVIDDASCSSTESFQVQGPAPINANPTIASVDCKGEATGAIQLNTTGGNGGFSYNWSTGATTNSITNLPAGTYSVVIEDSQGCQETESYTVTEPNQELMVNSIAPTAITQSTAGSVSLNVSGGTSPYSFSWSGPNGFSSASQNLSGLTEGGEYCVTIEDNRGCTTTACAMVINALRLNSNITDACFEEANGSITLNVDGGTPPYSYTWSNGGSAGPVLPNLAGGTYSVTVTDSANESVTSTFVVGESPEITANPMVVPVTGASGNNNGSITLNAAGGSQPLSYTWSGPNGFTSSSSSLSNLAMGTYCVTITDNNLGNNCTWESCFEIIFASPLQQAQLSAEGTSCSYTEDGTLTVTIVGGVAPYTVQVTTSEGEVISEQVSMSSFTFTNLPAGNTSVSVTDALGASLPSNSIMVPAAPSLIANPIDYQHATAGDCNGSVEISVSGGTAPYTVSWNNGAGNGTEVDELCGDFWYVPTVTDANGCTVDVDSTFINEFSVELVDVTDTDCPQDETGAIDIQVSGGDPGYIFTWIKNENTNIPVSNEEDLNNITSGNYTVIVEEPSGNTIMLEITVETSSELEVVTFVDTDYNGFDVSCPDAADGAARAVATGSTGYTYEWLDEEQMLVGMEAELEGLAAGTYQLVVTDELGCAMTNEVVLTAPDSMRVDGFVQNVRCHDGNNGAINVDIEGGLSPYNYFWSHGPTGERITMQAPGAYTVTVVDENNCEATGNFVIANPDPIELTVEMEPATEGCNGALLVMAEGGTAPYIFNWTTVPGDNNDAQIVDQCPGEYFVQVRDANGCLSALTSFEVMDRRFECLSESIVITPDDGNGQNDEFIIFCVGEYPQNHLEVYNRWGQLVFEVDNYDNTWNGTTPDGTELPAGAYYYVFEYTDPTGEPQQQKGSLTILRDE